MILQPSPNGIKFIEREEGCILGAYDDINDRIVKPGGTVRGTLTIGTGHTSAAGPPRVYVGMVITQAQADAILKADLASVGLEIDHLVKVSLNQNQADALYSFQFNIGALARSTTLRLLNQGNYTGAANAMLAWSRGNGNPTLLLGRRKREQTLFNLKV